MRSFSGRRGTVLFWVIIALDVIALLLLGLVLSGALVNEPNPRAPAAPLPAATAVPAGSTTRVPATEPAGEPTSTKHAPIGAVKTKLVVRAVRGDCWVSARAGGRTGRVLYADVLRTGLQMTVSARSIWLELGASGNVVVLVNGRARPVTPGTVAFQLS